jgi:DNA-binding transcriptional LysR family regulator
MGSAVQGLPRVMVATRRRRPDQRSRPLDPPIRPSLVLIWRQRRRRSPAAEAFLRHLAAQAPIPPTTTFD